MAIGGPWGPGGARGPLQNTNFTGFTWGARRPQKNF